MAKLNANDFEGRAPIGRHGLLAFIDELNERRARIGERARYKPQEDENGELAMVATRINPGDPPHTPSARYAAPRLVHG